MAFVKLRHHVMAELEEAPSPGSRVLYDAFMTDGISLDPEAVTRQAVRLGDAASGLALTPPAAPDAGRSSNEVAELLEVITDQLTAAAGSLTSLAEAALDAVAAFEAQDAQVQQSLQPSPAPSPTPSR